MKRTTTSIVALPLVVFTLSCVSSSAPEPSTSSFATRIHAIQGAAHRSPLEGKRVDAVEGVVTAVLAEGRAPGFWMQDPRPDRDAATSEAIFVSTKELTVDVAVGDRVSVSGDVAEPGFTGQLTTTQIVKPAIRTLSRGNALPAAVRLGAKGRAIPTSHVDDDAVSKFEVRDDAVDFWESLEGMRVEVHDAEVSTGTSGYGDIAVLADGAAGCEVRGIRGGVVLRAADFNPERILVDPRITKNPPAANTGDRFDGVIRGVVDYAFGNFRLVSSEPLPLLVASANAPESTALRGDATSLTVATYNVLNLGGTSDAAKFAAVASSIVANLGAPDVIGLQEIQDDSGPADDGVVSAAMTLGKLADAVVAAGGPRYEFRVIDPGNNEDGGQPGGNIRVAVFFNPARVSFVDRGSAGKLDATAVEEDGSGTRLTLSPGRVDPANPCFGSAEGGAGEPTRKSLAAELQFGGKTIFLIVNHLKSKRGDDAAFGVTQPPVYKTEVQRTCQAEVVGAFAASILARDPRAALVVLGDMNEHEFRRPMLRLAEISGLTNLVATLPDNDRYTFAFEGNLQVLDHVFVSPALAKGAEVDVVHCNADRADSLAASDHDPVVVKIRP